MGMEASSISPVLSKDIVFASVLIDGVKYEVPLKFSINGGTISVSFKKKNMSDEVAMKIANNLKAKVEGVFSQGE